MATMTNADVAGAAAALKNALARRDRAETNRVVAAMLDGQAPLGAKWGEISRLMQVSGEFSLAHRAIDAYVAASPDKARALYAKVVLYTQSGQLQEAHDLLKTLPTDVPDPGGHAYVLGNTAMTLGRVQEASDYLATALKHRPGWGPAWLSLSTAVNLADSPFGEQLLAEETIAQRQGPADLARYYYALGKLHADRKDHDATFAAFARGAELLRAETPYSRAGDEANSREAMTGYPAGFIERLNEQVSVDTSRPIFVTGLPRSGTTLVEQILASHSAVADGGELNIIQHVAVAAGGVSGEHLEKYLAGNGKVDTLADLYLHLLAERMGPAGRIVDKSIDVSRCLGLIASTLPDAPLIWMRRDPLDCAWSCFRTFFIHGVAWSYDLADIAQHFMLEDALCAFWQERLGDRLLVVPYTDLVEDPETWTRRLLDHCGLAEEAGAFAPHLTERRVATASALQVRRPINRDGLNVAAPYREQLQPFIDTYRPIA
ncbi:MAG: sulfotransferase [Sphingomonas sp.]|uniref:tetratricopeptide repeat-containing sulfotransferase family protein n=1 Tax=Sphingomonas sp. TaxID=28214 RepID=UPI001AC30FA3|nr:sulfotransferase [Sphingomonas sp.]MBN8815054.1 sulfotransferase [Sphingomonas sp.]